MEVYILKKRKFITWSLNSCYKENISDFYFYYGKVLLIIFHFNQKNKGWSLEGEVRNRDYELKFSDWHTNNTNKNYELPLVDKK